MEKVIQKVSIKSHVSPSSWLTTDIPLCSQKERKENYSRNQPHKSSIKIHGNKMLGIGRDDNRVMAVKGIRWTVHSSFHHKKN